MSAAGLGTEARAAAVERAVLDRISPPPEMLARVEEVVRHLVARAETEARERAIPLRRCLVAGSAARGTFLRDRVDLDFFLLFPAELDRASLERHGLALGRALLHAPETRYAEHPYLRGEFEGFAVDAVPGYAIDDPRAPKTAVDRTPFHQAYLSAHQTPESVGQVRLAKQFLRAHGLYGSEARTGGFSGYLVELLILRYGSLRGLLIEARRWKVPVRLESNPGAAPTVPDDVALVLDDPVDPHRNVASALSRRNLALFVLSAARYLVDPSDSAFELRPESTLRLAAARRAVAERGTHVLAVGLPRPALVDDILYPQLRKAERAVVAEAERLGFRPFASSSAAGDGRLLLLLELAHRREPLVRSHDGPPVGVDRAEEFLTKWPAGHPEVLQGPYVNDDGRLVVEVRRRERELEPLLAASLPNLALGRDLRAALDASVWVRPLDELEESPELVRALAGLLTKRLPWDDAASLRTAER